MTTNLFDSKGTPLAIVHPSMPGSTFPRISLGSKGSWLKQAK
ncbi:MAG: hypothetical protein RLZZ227_116 [Pseudomonadota bacterium]